jgi:hypothetical protein
MSCWSPSARQGLDRDHDSLRNNEIIKKATLTVRKAGDTALEYLKITLEQARSYPMPPPVAAPTAVRK